MTVPVLTISSRVPHESYYHYQEFLKSCSRQGFDPIFIPCHPYCGLMSKPKYLLEWLEKNGASFANVIVCDAWDIIFLTTPDDILYNWQVFGSPIVFNAERNCFPAGELEPRFQATSSPYRFLNSGFIVAKTEWIINMLREMRDRYGGFPDDSRNPDGSWNSPNDQETYSRWFLDHQDWAKLDYAGILCQSLHGAGDREFAYIPDRKRVVSLLTKNEPCVCHGNGSGKEWLKKIIGWLNL